MSYWKERFSSFCSYQHSNSGISTSISSDMKRFAGAKLKQSFNVKSLQFNTPPLSVMWFNNCKLKITKTQEAKTANTLRPDVERKSTRATPKVKTLFWNCPSNKWVWNDVITQSAHCNWQAAKILQISSVDFMEQYRQRFSVSLKGPFYGERKRHQHIRLQNLDQLAN